MKTDSVVLAPSHQWKSEFLSTLDENKIDIYESFAIP